jgi:hypothetical protein
MKNLHNDEEPVHAETTPTSLLGKSSTLDMTEPPSESPRWHDGFLSPNHPYYQNIMLALIVARLLQLGLTRLLVASRTKQQPVQQHRPLKDTTKKDNAGRHVQVDLSEPSVQLADDKKSSNNHPIDWTMSQRSAEKKTKQSTTPYSTEIIASASATNPSYCSKPLFDTETTRNSSEKTHQSSSSFVNALGGEKDAVLLPTMIIYRPTRHDTTATINPWAPLNSIEPTTTEPTTEPPTILHSTTNTHSGLASFHDWFDTEASLFRIYERARSDGPAVTLPYYNRRRRGTVPIVLHVENATLHTRIAAYWVNDQGKLVAKGSFGPGETWTQTTYVDHPWVFCKHTNNYNDDDELPTESEILLHYIPYRVIPTTSQEPTLDPHNPDCGLHRFAIQSPARDDDSVFKCHVVDQIFPFPSSEHLIVPEFALDKVLLHCYRMDYQGWPILGRYLANIVQHPGDCKYRRLRMANPNFAQHVWLTPAKGILLALGFVEHGAFVELGSSEEPLSRERVQDVARLLYCLEQWQAYAE